MVTITKGFISVQTQNLRTEFQPRRIANFEHVAFCRLKSVETDEILFCWQIKIGDKVKNVFLLSEKIGRPTYLLRKLREVGGDIVARTLAEKKNYVCQLTAMLIADCNQVIKLPMMREWYLDNGKIAFFHGNLTWQEVQKWSK